MKKILLCMLGAGLFVTSYAQDQQQGGGLGIEMGIRGAAASDWLFNSNVSGTATQSYAPAFSFNYGFDVCLDINQHIGIEVNVLWGQVNMGYNGKFGTTEALPQESNTTTNGAYPFLGWSGSPFSENIANGESFVAKTSLNVMEIPLLFRYGSGNGAYVEIGPAYQSISSAGYTVTYSNGPVAGVNNYSNVDVSNAFGKTNVLAVLGFGDDFQIGSTGLNIITNLRFYYGFMDLVGVDGHGQYLAQTLPDGSANNYLYKDPYGGAPSPYYAGYKNTWMAGASFSLGVYYWIGFTKSTGGRTACKHPPKVKD